MKRGREGPGRGPSQVAGITPPDPSRDASGIRVSGMKNHETSTQQHEKEHVMNTGENRATSGIGRTLLGALALVALVAFGNPNSAVASTAANTTITNTVTVNFDNTSGVAQTAATSSIAISVQLVASIPTLSEPGDQGVNLGATVDYSYTLTATANGPDTYNLSDDSASATLGDASLTLGATTLAADTDGTTTITVPYDGTDDNVVNGITYGDTIVIGGVAYTVESLANAGIEEDQTGAPNTATITLTGNVTAGTGAGAIVGERQSFTLTVDAGSDPSTADGTTITVVVTAESDTDATVEDTDTTVTTTTVANATLTVTKEVSVNGGAFFNSTQNADPTDTLTYRITVTNDSAAVNAESVKITDPEPQFTTYVGGSAERAASGVVYNDVANTVLTDLDAGDDNYDFDVTTPDTITFSVGTLAPSATVVLYYQVQIN